MNFETQGLGAGSYPEPKENTKTVHIEITITGSNDIEVPKNWDKERIRDNIRANLDEYFADCIEEDWEVEISG